MTENKKKEFISKETKAYALKLLIIIIAAFVTALVFRRSAGIIAMTPLVFIICGFAAFIGIDLRTKLIVFGITVFTMNTIEQDDMTVTLIFTALCLLACGAFGVAAKLIKQHKKSGFHVMIWGAALCVGMSLVLIGNPISATSAKSEIEGYTEWKYPQNDNGVLGKFEFSSIYYDYASRTYRSEAVSSKYPTEKGIISYDGVKVSDNFKSITKEKISEPYILEITGVLREYFPNDSFIVTYDSIDVMPDESIYSAEADELYKSITYEITLGGVQTANDMTDRVEQYISAIDGSGMEYSKIIFKSGIGPWVRRSVTVYNNRPKGFGKYLIDRVPAGTSNSFNRYLLEFANVR